MQRSLPCVGWVEAEAETLPAIGARGWPGLSRKTPRLSGNIAPGQVGDYSVG